MDEPSAGVGLLSQTAPDDAVDVALAASGNGHAFERLYRRHVARVHSLARRMTGPEHADELTQDVFVRAWEKLGTFRGEAAFGTWLHRLAVNLILSRRSRFGVERSRFDGADEALALQPAATARPELAIDFESAIARLPEGARRVFVLHDVEGYRHDEIGELMGIAVGTSKAQLHRARMLLRSHLEPQSQEGRQR
jgi:RNA polymerase sigma-70 factor (ECF subfamily)